MRLLDKSIMTLNLEAKKILLRKIPHGLFICGVRDEDKNEVNGFTASWVTQGSFTPPLVVMAVRACLLYTSPSPRDISGSRMPSSA